MNAMEAPLRRKKTAAERRAQRLRAEARLAQRLLRALASLDAHRGCASSRLGAALFAALRGDAPMAKEPVEDVPLPAADEPMDAAVDCFNIAADDTDSDGGVSDVNFAKNIEPILYNFRITTVVADRAEEQNKRDAEERNRKDAEAQNAKNAKDAEELNEKDAEKLNKKTQNEKEILNTVADTRAKLNEVGTISDLAARGLLVVGNVLECSAYGTVLLRGGDGHVYETAGSRVRVLRLFEQGWYTTLCDSAEEPNRNARGSPVFGLACIANGDAAVGLDETFRIADEG